MGSNSENGKMEDLLKQMIRKIAHLDEKISKTENQINSFISSSETRYRDLLSATGFTPEFVPAEEVELITEHKLASESVDHLYPRGTANDNTRWPRFAQKCESLFPGKVLNYLDLGCAGGGLVLDFALRGHFSMGLEGSDYSYKRQRAEWRTIPGNLYLCDIAEEYTVLPKDSVDPQKFHIITAWDVIEHIEQEKLKNFLDNVKRHLGGGGYFIGSVSTRPAGGTMPDGRNHHATIENRDWWEKLFKSSGFDLVENHTFIPVDFPRGNGIQFPANFEETPELGFYFVLSKSN